jgi:sugar phosphate isomerase/epimerase
MDTGTGRKVVSAAEQAQMLQELGYDGLGYTGLGGINEMIEELQKRDLKMFTTYLGVTIDPDGKKYDAALPETINKLKGKDVILWLTVNSRKFKPSDPNGDPYAVEVLREIADMAEPAGLKIALYPHITSWVERVGDAVRVVKKVDRPNVGVTFNLCHWLKVEGGANMRPLMESAMPYLFLVTINGADSGDTKNMNWDRLIRPLDSGSYDTFMFLKTLKEFGYTGPIGLQHYGIKGDARQNLERSMNGWRHLSNKMRNTWPSNYYPDGMFVWDTWYLQDGDTTHVYNLQVKRPGKNVDQDFMHQKDSIVNYVDETDKATFEGTIGHATSKNLLRWTQQPTAVFRTDAAKVGGRENAYDDGVLFTGCAVKHQGGNARRYVQGDRRDMATICLATSTDGIHYKKHPKNPLFMPDPNRYYTYPEPPAPFKHHARRGTDCRDILVIKDPGGEGWLGYVVMRRKGFNDAFHSACIVLCRSENLIDWEVGDPVCTPNRFNCFEVPDVFKLGSKWYMIALTGDVYGQADRWADKDIAWAAIVFEADSAYGPFLEVRDNLLLSSSAKNGQGIVARTVERNGERLMFYTHSEVSTGRGRLSWPEKLIPRAEGGLDSVYWAGVNNAFETSVDASATKVTSDQSGTKLTKVKEWNQKDPVYMITANVDLHIAQGGGIAFGSKDGNSPLVSAQIDSGAGPEGLVSIEHLGDKEIIQKREMKIARKGVCKLRVIVCDDTIKFYVDERLILTHYVAGIIPGDIYLYARQGEVRYKNLKYYSGKTK